METTNADASLIATLLARLERIPADSRWAHRASGLRGALLDIQQALEDGQPVDSRRLDDRVRAGLELLSRAGMERVRGRPIHARAKNAD